MQQIVSPSPVVAVERRIVIQASAEQVFAYAADLRNDAHWRAEVHGTRLHAEQPAVGAVATEDAYLSPREPHSLTELEYLVYEPGRRMHCVSVAGSPHRLSVERRFRPLGPGTTEFVYGLEFEARLVRQALGFALPGWLLRWHTGRMMERYQRTLKRLLEAAA
ncbi:hypothetical protein GCM10027048_39260 [Hymenobacter coalescens]